MRYISIFVLYIFFNSSILLADECSRNTSTGVNENTLCIKHYINEIDPDHIDYGSGMNAHHGPSVDPLRPNVGTYIQEKKFKNNEYYIEVKTGDSVDGVRIKTNKGRIFTDK